MTIWKSMRRREKAFGAITLFQTLLFGIAFALVAYFILFFRNCVSDPKCDFSKFGSLTDPILATIIGVLTAMVFYLVQYFPQNVKSRIEDFERCADLKKQLTALQSDYIQIKNVQNIHVLTIINQKNSRLIIIENIADLLRYHYNHELSQDLSFICEKGIRFPCSLDESSRKELEHECDMMIPLIDDVLVRLNKKPHDKHKYDSAKVAD